MRRLAATLWLDLRLQQKNGFYYAVGFLLACWFIVLSQLPDVDWRYVMPPLVFGNLATVNFYFIAGLVLLEKGEGTLEAQIVTPLLDWEYLASKTVTLVALSLVEQFVIAVSAVGLGFGLVTFAVGVALAGALYTLTGFVLAVRYGSINEYLFPSVLYLLALSVPMVYYFELSTSWLLLVHPLTAPLLLLKAAFVPIPSWQWAYGVGYSLLWIALLVQLDRWGFDRFIVAREGSA